MMIMALAAVPGPAPAQAPLTTDDLYARIAECAEARRSDDTPSHGWHRAMFWACFGGGDELFAYGNISNVLTAVNSVVDGAARDYAEAGLPEADRQSRIIGHWVAWSRVRTFACTAAVVAASVCARTEAADLRPFRGRPD